MAEIDHQNAANPKRTEFDQTAGDAEVAGIRADIQETRQRMSHTVEDIGERLNPERLRQQLKHNLHEATIGKAEHMARSAADRVDETRHSIVDSIRDNPVPAALVGIGLGWIFLNSRRTEGDHYAMAPRQKNFGGSSARTGFGGYPDSYRPFYNAEAGTYHSDTHRVSEPAHPMRNRADTPAPEAHDRVTEIAHQARETMREVADRAEDVVEDTASRARSWAGDVTRSTRRGTHRVEDRLDETLRESPLAVGAAAVALGLAVGLAAPATRRESEWVGPARDDLVERARRATEEVTGRVQDVAERVVEQAQTMTKQALDDSKMS